jgi:hypothetical protein
MDNDEHKRIIRYILEHDDLLKVFGELFEQYLLLMERDEAQKAIDKALGD